jgi:uncharacterized protein (DUF1015 family)
MTSATPDAATRPPTPDALVLAPLRALRFAAGRVGDIASVLCPPYDVIDEPERVELEARNPHNVVRLILPRDASDGADRYTVAGRLLAEWRSEGALVPDAAPALYVYEETLGTHVQRGLLGALGLVSPEANIVLPHENTMAGPVSDRLALTEATDANLEPIFLVYDGGGAASRLVAGIAERTPLVDVTTPDGIRHRLWALDDPGELAAVADDLSGRRAVIADGHHRYATYLRHQADRHAAGHGNGPWDFGLTFLVDASAFGPQVEPIHRVIPGLPPGRAAELAASGFTLQRVQGSVTDAESALAVAGKAGTAFVVTDGTDSWLLTEPDAAQLASALPADRSDAWRRLDVTVAHLYLVRSLWGLEDTEQTVDYRHDVASAIEAARSSGGCALLLNPTPVEDVIAVAAAGERMPRKSTLFVPKPTTGLVIRAFADA